jgi:hypothetical protein
VAGVHDRHRCDQLSPGWRATWSSDTECLIVHVNVKQPWLYMPGLFHLLLLLLLLLCCPADHPELTCRGKSIAAGG